MFKTGNGFFFPPVAIIINVSHSIKDRNLYLLYKISSILQMGTLRSSEHFLQLSIDLVEFNSHLGRIMITTDSVLSVVFLAIAESSLSN